jgi:dCMP deaminase
MNKQEKLDFLYMDIAARVSDMSYGRRLKVGAVIVKGDNVISMGWNGMPSGMDNNCEIEHEDGHLSTRPETLHAESNALMKLARSGGVGSLGATIYTTYSPCPECAKLIKQAGISRVVYRHNYRLLDGIDMLKALDVPVIQLKGQNESK